MTSIFYIRCSDFLAVLLLGRHFRYITLCDLHDIPMIWCYYVNFTHKEVNLLKLVLSYRDLELDVGFLFPFIPHCLVGFLALYLRMFYQVITFEAVPDLFLVKLAPASGSHLITQFGLKCYHSLSKFCLGNLPSAGFINSTTIDILGQIAICCGYCPIH